MSDIAGLKKNVGFLNWASAALLTAGVAAFFMLDASVEDVASDVVEIKIQSARQSALLESIAQKLDGDGYVEGGPQSGQTRTVR